MPADPASTDLFTLLRHCSVPTLNSVMTKAGLSSGHMRHVAPVGPNRRFVGRAVTLRAIPVRDDLKARVIAGELPNLQMEAFEQLGPDDVLVINSLCDLRAAVFGDVMATYAQLRGAAAIVIDGCVSDQQGIAALQLPVFARGNACSWALTYLHFTERNGPIGCDGIAVLPGDLVVGDGNGVVVLPAHRAADIAATAAEREEIEVYILDRIGAGASLMEIYPINEATRAAFPRLEGGTRLKILIMDAMAGADLTIEHAEADGHDIVAMQTRPGEAYPDEVYAGCDALLNCRGRHTLPAATLAKLTRCRVIVQGGVGFNHVDLAAAADLGIPVCNTPDYGTAEVADHAIALMLGLLRGVLFYDQALQQADTPWAPQPLPTIRRVTDLRVGIVGLGRIGLATALRLRGFGMRVAFHDPHQPPGVERATGFERHDSLARLLERSDVVSLHCPLSPATANLIGAAEFACLPAGAILVNTARGGLVDLDALATALRGGRLAGAALDVLPQEPIDRSHPLLADWAAGAAWLRGRLIVTPHVAFHSPESVADMRRLSMRAVAGYLRDGTLRSCVNAALLTAPRPWH